MKFREKRFWGATGTQPAHLDASTDFSASNGRSRTDSTVTGVAEQKIRADAKNTSSATGFAGWQAGVVRRLWGAILLIPVMLAAVLGPVPIVSSAPVEPPSSLPTGQAGPDARATRGSVVRTNNPGAIRAIAAKNKLKITREIPIPDGETLLAVDVSHRSSAAQSFESSGRTEVYPNYIYKATATPNDPNYSSQWALPKISMPTAWDVTTGSSDITIAVIDSGILFSQTIDGTTYSQPDFPSSRRWENVAEIGTTAMGELCWTGIPADKSTNGCDDDSNGKVDDWQGWDFMGGFRSSSAACPNYGDPVTYQHPTVPDYVLQDNDPQPYSCDSPNFPSILNKNHADPGTGCGYSTRACYVGHGTMVASVAGAAANNNELVAGVDWSAKLMNLRVLDGYGIGETVTIEAAIRYAADNGADIINMSLAAAPPCTQGYTDTGMEDAMSEAKAAGATIVAASGNAGTNVVCYPASSTHAIAAGASDQNDNRTSFSSYGPELDLVAPGIGITVANAPSAHLNSNLANSVAGTSFSSPHVAGVAALVKARFPSSTPNDIKKYLTHTADKVSGMNGQFRTDPYGYGRLNARRAVTVDQLSCPNTLIPNQNIDSAPAGEKFVPHRLDASENQALTLVLHNKTNTGCIETRRWMPPQTYWIREAPTNHPAIDIANSEVISADVNGDGGDQLIFIKYRNTGSGRIEAHIWSRGQQNWVSNIATNHPAVNPADNAVIAADVTGDGSDEILFIKYRNNDSGRIEVHTWSSSLQGWYSNIATNHPVVNPADNAVIAADTNGDGRDELLFIKYRNNGSGKIEVHTWDHTYQNWVSNIATNHPAVNPDDTGVLSANIVGDKRDELVFAKYRNTGSNKIEAHVWTKNLQGWIMNTVIP